MTPQTDREWAKMKALFHPDGPTPDVARFIAIQEQQAAWKLRRPRACRQCGKPCQPASDFARVSVSLCGKVCGARYAASQRRKPKRLTRGR